MAWDRYNPAATMLLAGKSQTGCYLEQTLMIFESRLINSKLELIRVVNHVRLMSEVCVLYFRQRSHIDGDFSCPLSLPIR